MAKYGKMAQKKVKKAMHERKEGTLKSGKSGKKVTSKKQAIAIGLSEARKEGGKVPKKKRSSSKKEMKLPPESSRNCVRVVTSSRDPLVARSWLIKNRTKADKMAQAIQRAIDSPPAGISKKLSLAVTYCRLTDKFSRKRLYENRCRDIEIQRS